MKFKFLCTLALAMSVTFQMGSQVASAEPILNADQINSLKLERRLLIDQREEMLVAIVTNEAQLQFLMNYADGKIPSVQTREKEIAAVIASGVAGTGGAYNITKLISLPAFLTELSPALQHLLKTSPAVTSLIVAGYLAYDTYKTQAQLAAVKAKVGGSYYNAIDLYNALKRNRAFLNDEIAEITHQIIALDKQLNLYE